MDAEEHCGNEESAAIHLPNQTAQIKNPAALETIQSISPMLAEPCKTRASITVSTTSPSTSSMTAAPRMIFDSRAWILPRSLSTRAVIPTLVEQIDAPMNRWVCHGCRGSSQELANHPNASEAETPHIATVRADPPTRRNSLTLHSRPTSNNRMITPIRASVSSVTAARFGP